MRKLTNLEISEISLVDVPANKTRFYVTKRKTDSFEKDHLSDGQDGKNDNKKKKEVNEVDELIKLYKSLYKEEDAKEMKVETKDFKEEDVKIVKNALDVFKKYKDDLPDELADEIVNLAKFAVSKYPEDEKEDDTEVEKAGAKLSKDSLANLKKAIECLMSILPEEDQPEVKKTDEKEEVKDEKEEKVEKKEESKEKKIDEDKKELEKSLKELKESILEEISKSSKVVEGIATRLEKVEEVKGVKKNLEEEAIKKEKEKKSNWPSLVPDDEE